MPQSLSNILVHVVFSTKDRTADHVHLAVHLSRTLTIAKLVETVKTSSSKWLKPQSPSLAGFGWQRGSGAFSVGPTDLDASLAYIDNQEE